MCKVNSRLARPAITLLTLGGLAMGIAGCAASASHSGEGGEYTRYVMSLYNDPATLHGLRTIEFPVNVAVAQVGETAPLPAVMEKLRAAKGVFAHIESLPAEERALDDRSFKEVGARDPIHRLQSLARDQGADYLLIYGATVESHTRVNSLSVADLTIVGAYVPGTRNIEATGRGSAALIDVRTGNVVLSAGAEAKDHCIGSAASADGNTDELSAKVHDEALVNLADQVIATARRRAGEQAAADTDTPPLRQAAPAVAREK